MVAKGRSRNVTEDPIVFTAVLVGAVLTLTGILGPLVGGPEGEFIVFGRNYLHDAIHVVTGLAGLAGGYYAGGRLARTYAISFGAVYLAVAVLGVLYFETLQDLIALNIYDNVLHFMLALVLTGVGIAFGGRQP